MIDTHSRDENKLIALKLFHDLTNFKIICSDRTDI